MKKTMPFFLLAAVFATLTAQAAQWTPIGNGSKDSGRVEIDSASLHTPTEGRVRLWYRETYPTPRLPDSGAFSYTRLTTLSEFLCDKRQLATLQQTYARADGTELKTEIFDARETRPVTPDSREETLFNHACKSRSKPAAATQPPPAPPPTVAEPAETTKRKNGKKPAEDPPPPPPPAHWGYSGNSGPDKWGALDKDYATCSLGQRQSPIDIRKTVKADLPAIQFAYKSTPLSIIDNGHSIKVDTADAGAISIDGESYVLKQFHFHRPSEEKINGKAYDMVAHLVHQSKEGKLAVVAVLMEAGKKDHPLIRTLWTHLPLEQDKPVTRKETRIDPSDLLPSRRNYFTFLGSLTTPPCTEGVLWLVLKTPVQVSKEQLGGFATIYRNNVRPVQPTNNRVIKEGR